MLNASNLRSSDIDGLALASYRLAPDHAANVCEYLGLSTRFLVDLPNGGASGPMALRRAARAIQMGDAEVVACIGADVVPQGAVGANFSGFSRAAVYPYGAGGPNGVFALITEHYSGLSGAQAEDYGRVCVAQRANAVDFPHALLRKPLTLEEYLASRPVADPLRLFDCVMRCCGAEGFLVMSEDRARRCGVPWVRIAGAVERHNGRADELVQASVGAPGDSDSLYAQAGMGPQDMDFVQLYDDYPVIVMLQLESLGFCPAGGAPDFVRQHDLRCEGDFPLNTSGGMLSVGQAGAAGGFLGMTEALRQLTDRTLGRSVQRALAGLVSGYGNVNYDRGICTAAAILTRGG